MEPSRLLAFAFANADVLFEVDRSGRVVFATGATREFGFDDNADGSAAMLFASADQARFAILTSGLASGDRAGPIPVTLANGNKAQLSLCDLPQNEGILSCTLAHIGQRKAMAAGIDPQTGLPDHTAFLNAVGKSDGTLSLVNLRNLPEACAGLSPKETQSLLAHVGKTIDALGADVAGRISDSAFGVVSKDPAITAKLAASVAKAAKEKGVGGLETEGLVLPLRARGLSAEQTMLAVRHVVGHFADGTMTKTPANLTEVFDTLLQKTIAIAEQFNATVADGKFALVFEPIVNLATSKLCHYEALSRFSPEESPAEIIKFAEDIGLADAFDLAVAIKVLAAVEKDQAGSCVAFNVSGRSIGSPEFFATLTGLLTKKRHLAKRILIEITESAEIADLAGAEESIQTLRQLGYRVGIDDFGAGAASLQYLHGLTVDFVKVDGALVRRMGKSPREDALLRGILKTCAELHIETIAEWIDDGAKLERCREAGFGLGQGRYLGGGLTALPAPELMKRARRLGTQESWG